MRATFFRSAIVLLAVSTCARAETVVRAPLIGLTGTTRVYPGTWFTETRIWNLAPQAATVRITDVIGSNSIQPRTFTVPPNAVLDLPYWEFIGGDPSARSEFAAMVEFTSDQPIVVDTSVNTYEVPEENCNFGGGPGGPTVFPYWAGCVPIAGPLLRGFESYLEPGKRNGLSWLVTDWVSYRTNLYITNPGNSILQVSGTYRSVNESPSVTVSYTVPPRSLRVLPQLFLDPRLQELRFQTENEQGAATAVFTADGPFYIFAVVLSNDIFEENPSVLNRFAIVQPLVLPE